MVETLKTVSPIDGSVYVERPLATTAELDSILTRAHAARADWRSRSRVDRAERLTAFLDHIKADKNRLATELTWQMGRPIAQAPGELAGFDERGRAMIRIGLDVLADEQLPEKSGFKRFIRREPLGVVLVLAPWNYPWLTSVNAVVPALMAGNTVVLKHAYQTPLVAERMVEAARAAEIPDGVFQFVHMGHDRVAQAVADPRVGFVAFTGSVGGGHAVQRAAAERFIHVGLELGGKDPAYVLENAALEAAAEGLVDGAFFNSGQSCCGIERVYVHAAVADEFVERAVALVNAYRLDDPRKSETNLGPVVRASSAQQIRKQVEAAVASGARTLIDAGAFPEAGVRGDPYLAPQIVVDVTHEMELMTEETFGPVMAIMRVTSDEEAVAHMNDSRYGLTAALYTTDPERALHVASSLDTGTVFMNRCDYLDPELPWVGVKDSGNGCTLSKIGYEHLTRPKSFHFRLG